jgi:hypothetical protein
VTLADTTLSLFFKVFACCCSLFALRVTHCRLLLIPRCCPRTTLCHSHLDSLPLATIQPQVKTLHPFIHGGLLANRSIPAHMDTIKVCGGGGDSAVVVCAREGCCCYHRRSMSVGDVMLERWCTGGSFGARWCVGMVPVIAGKCVGDCCGCGGVRSRVGVVVVIISDECVAISHQ